MNSLLSTLLIILLLFFSVASTNFENFTTAQTAINLHISILDSSIKVAMPNNVTIVAKDHNNVTVTNYSGSVDIFCSDPNAILPSNSTLTLTNGAGSFVMYFGTADTHSITAADSANNLINGTLFVSAAPIHFDITSSPSSITVGSPVNVMVTALDVSDNVLVDLGKFGIGASIEFSSSDVQAQFPAPESSNLIHGVRVFSVTLLTPGSQTITIKSKDFSLVQAITNTITVNSLQTATPTPSPPPISPTTSPSPDAPPTGTITPLPSNSGGTINIPTLQPTPSTTSFQMQTPTPFTIPESQVILIAAIIAIVAIIVVIGIVILSLEKNGRIGLGKKDDTENKKEKRGNR
jgi:hypothetical protein